MPDKQIIIDGVDVSGCEFLRNCIIPDNYGCKIDDSLCCDVGNCNYKQLKRKEQECFELQKTANAYNYLVKLANYRLDKIEDLQQRLNQLKAENERLKGIANRLLEKRNKYLDKWGKYLIYRKTLTEIKEITEPRIVHGLTDMEYVDIYSKTMEQILEKISEVEDELN